MSDHLIALSIYLVPCLAAYACFCVAAIESHFAANRR
jgi:hypothetical protein